MPTSQQLLSKVFKGLESASSCINLGAVLLSGAERRRRKKKSPQASISRIMTPGNSRPPIANLVSLQEGLGSSNIFGKLLR